MEKYTKAKNIATVERESYSLLKKLFIHLTIENLVNKKKRNNRDKIKDSS